jgi:hypothetical protein
MSRLESWDLRHSHWDDLSPHFNQIKTISDIIAKNMNRKRQKVQKKTKEWINEVPDKYQRSDLIAKRCEILQMNIFQLKRVNLFLGFFWKVQCSHFRTKFTTQISNWGHTGYFGNDIPEIIEKFQEVNVECCKYFRTIFLN